MEKLGIQLESALILRICHDLITPFNAISLGMDAFLLSREDDLLKNLQHSINKANAVLKFTRELFSTRSDTFCYASATLNQIVVDFLQCYGISFDIKSDFNSVPSIAAKIIMYTAVIMKEIMPYGGTMVTSIDNESSTITTRGSGRSIFAPEIAMTTEPSYRNIMRHNFAKLLSACGFELEVIQDGSNIVLVQKLC
ncbi:MAG: hypothetical protein LBT90_02140 [Holosporaceae bacterium]|jgi:hypothetical protein|nr:hypothetical protein [Holosporaceae bacterium]